MGQIPLVHGGWAQEHPIQCQVLHQPCAAGDPDVEKDAGVASRGRESRSSRAPFARSHAAASASATTTASSSPAGHSSRAETTCLELCGDRGKPSPASSSSRPGPRARKSEQCTTHAASAVSSNRTHSVAADITDTAGSGNLWGIHQPPPGLTETGSVPPCRGRTAWFDGIGQGARLATRQYAWPYLKTEGIVYGLHRSSAISRRKLVL
jgi:hypothetical protein